jgi:hypothetical protein
MRRVGNDKYGQARAENMVGYLDGMYDMDVQIEGFSVRHVLKPCEQTLALVQPHYCGTSAVGIRGPGFRMYPFVFLS